MFLMTPVKRARVPSTGVPERDGAVTPIPCRHATMTAKDDSPQSGHERIDFRTDHKRLQAMSDDRLAEVLEEQKQATREAASAVDRALLNEDVPLTDEKVAALWDAAGAVEAIARSLPLRVPEQHQIEEEEQ